ncbi:hypothetical protein [Streptococcus equi]|nr:hypothetical protein [Streptococcus equi]AEJ25496.1 hypothetical protein SeseC_01555 [Streptococcus equi subsp. zooepidemicus ATCC 35246]
MSSIFDHILKKYPLIPERTTMKREKVKRLQPPINVISHQFQ